MLPAPAPWPYIADFTRPEGLQRRPHWALVFPLAVLPLKLSHHRLLLYICSTITLRRFPPTVQFSASVVISM
uniref:Uncharacterized protein n=1 Tax=Siphoviridae sp. ctss15 TaxID=2825699 RepID=A0A8S5TR95_9CAUD|nr:MAG TPA: hypothetical protein [Siphoviridae sp. ctss15]